MCVLFRGNSDLCNCYKIGGWILLSPSGSLDEFQIIPDFDVAGFDQAGVQTQIATVYLDEVAHDFRVFGDHLNNLKFLHHRENPL